MYSKNYTYNGIKSNSQNNIKLDNNRYKNSNDQVVIQKNVFGGSSTKM